MLQASLNRITPTTSNLCCIRFVSYALNLLAQETWLVLDKLTLLRVCCHNKVIPINMEIPMIQNATISTL